MKKIFNNVFSQWVREFKFGDNNGKYPLTGQVKCHNV